MDCAKPNGFPSPPRPQSRSTAQRARTDRGRTRVREAKSAVFASARGLPWTKTEDSREPDFRTPEPAWTLVMKLKRAREARGHVNDLRGRGSRSPLKVTGRTVAGHTFGRRNPMFLPPREGSRARKRRCRGNPSSGPPNQPKHS